MRICINNIILQIQRIQLQCSVGINMYYLFKDTLYHELPALTFKCEKTFQIFNCIFLILWFCTARRTRSLYVIWVLLLKPCKRNKHSLFYRLILHTLHPGKAPHHSQHKIFMTNNQAHSQHKKYIPVVEENIVFAQCLLISPLHASFCRSELFVEF